MLNLTPALYIGILETDNGPALPLAVSKDGGSNHQMSLPSCTGTGIAGPASLLLPEDQDVAEAELTNALGAQVDQVGFCRAGADTRFMPEIARANSVCASGGR